MDLHLMEDRDSLHYARETIRTTDAAFCAASTTGATHIETILSTLNTLQHATIVAYPCGVIGAAHEEGSNALQKLRMMVRRLQIGCDGLVRRCENVQVEAVKSYVKSIVSDMDRKKQVLQKLERYILSGGVLKDDDGNSSSEKLIARWMEMEDRAEELGIDVILSMLEAIQIVNETKYEQERTSSTNLSSPISTKTKQLSPALKMLTKRNNIH